MNGGYDGDLGKGRGGRDAQFSLPTMPRYSTDESTSPPASSALLLDLMVNIAKATIWWSPSWQIHLVNKTEVDLSTCNYHHLPSPKVENSAAMRGPSHKRHQSFERQSQGGGQRRSHLGCFISGRATQPLFSNSSTVLKHRRFASHTWYFFHTD